MNFQLDDPKSGGGEYFGSSPYAGGADEYTGGGVFTGIFSRKDRTDHKFMAAWDIVTILWLVVIMILTATSTAVPREVIILASMFGAVSIGIEIYSCFYYNKGEWNDNLTLGNTAPLRAEIESLRAELKLAKQQLGETA